MIRNNQSAVLRKLLEIVAAQGYVTFDNIMDCADDNGLSLVNFGLLSNKIALHHIPICDKDPSFQHDGGIDESIADNYQTDRNSIYSEILLVCPSMKSVVDKIRSIRPPHNKETVRLKYLAKNGINRAREKMIEMHLDLALRIGFQRATKYDADIAETIGDAFIGLISAVDEYDPEIHGLFISYASRLIVKSIMQELPTQNPLVNYPAEIRKSYYTVYPLLKSGCFFEDADIVHNAAAIDLICQRIKCTPEQLEDIWSSVIPFESLEEIIRTNGEENYGIHSLWYEDASPFDALVAEMDNTLLHKAIMKMLSSLSLREALILKLRYGIDDGKPRTLAEVGLLLQLSRERVRQIEVQALKKMRCSRNMQLLDGLYDTSGRETPSKKEVHIFKAKEAEQVPSLNQEPLSDDTIKRMDEVEYPYINFEFVHPHSKKARTGEKKAKRKHAQLDTSGLAFLSWMTRNVSDSVIRSRVLSAINAAHHFAQERGRKGELLFGCQSIAEARSAINGLRSDKTFEAVDEESWRLMSTDASSYFLTFISEAKGNKDKFI